MLRFFRHIRKQLMEKNKVRTYALYAIGEILLVVVGILIAVQVNATIESSKKETRRVEMVKDLRLEFKNNLAQLDTAIFYQNLALNASNELIQVIANRENDIPKQRIDSLISNVSWFWTYDPTNGVLSNSISSGDIHLIGLDSLQVLLFSWGTLVDDSAEEQVRSVNQYQEHLVPYLEDRISISNTVFYYKGLIPKSSFSYDYQAFIFDPKFENLLASRSILLLDILSELEPLRMTNLAILELLEEEIETN